jgi:hypothetical protein
MAENLDKLKVLKQSYNSAFSSEAGQKVLEDLEKWCYIKTTTFPFNTPDALLLAFNEGKRAVILHIKTMMEFDIQRISEMLNQQTEGGI